jgi:hypothetical protein
VDRRYLADLAVRSFEVEVSRASCFSPTVHFATATNYVNEYAASGLDEYFAESIRAYVEVNDPACAWLPLTRQDLFLRDPRMFALADRLFASGFQSRERRMTGRRAYSRSAQK